MAGLFLVFCPGEETEAKQKPESNLESAIHELCDFRPVIDLSVHYPRVGPCESGTMPQLLS